MKLVKSFIILLAFSPIFLGIKVQAQTGNNDQENPVSKSFISVSGGIAIPVGNFASTLNNTGSIGSVYSTPAGFAQMGTNFALEGAYYFYKYIGIGGILSTSSFYLNTKDIALGYVIDYDCDEASAQANPYHTINFLIGPYFSYPYKKFQFELRILGGITSTQFPTVNGTVINLPGGGPYEGSTSDFYQTSATAAAFGFQTGIGVKYNIYKHFTIGLRGDYFYSKPSLSFNNVNRTNVGRIETGYNQPIEGFTATFGIGYQF